MVSLIFGVTTSIAIFTERPAKRLLSHYSKVPNKRPLPLIFFDKKIRPPPPPAVIRTPPLINFWVFKSRSKKI